MNTVELLTDDKNFDNLMFFIKLLRISERGATEDVRMSAGNLVWSWESILTDSGFTYDQLEKIRKAVV